MAFAALYVFGGPVSVLPLLGITLAAGLAVASVAPLWGRNPLRAPLFTWGMVVAHLGVAVSLAGMASNAAFTKETLVAARVDQPVRVGPYRVTLNGIRPVIGANWSGLEGILEAQLGTGTAFALAPQQRFFSAPPTTTNEAAIITRWNGQLYAVLGQPDGTGRWQLRLWWKPFVTLIWAGGMLIAIGGALSLIGRVRRERRAAWREAVA